MHISESKPSPLLDLDPGSTSLVLDKRRGSVRPSTFPIKTSEPTASLGSNSVDDIDISKAPKIKLKLIMLGNTTVGKTTLLHRYCNGDWSNAATTCGIDLRLKRVKVNETWVKLSIWDTAGQERFQSLTSQYYRKSDGILLVYDVGNRSSFSNLAKWFSNLEEKLPSKDYARIPKILVANKIDGRREVMYEEGKAYADSFDCGFVETSAFTNQCVDKAFEWLISQILQSKDEEKREEEPRKGEIRELTVELRGSKENTKRSSGGCCS